MTREELSDEIRAVMFLLSSEAALDGHDDRILNSAHRGLMQLIDRYLDEHAREPVVESAGKPRRGHMY